MHYKFALVSLAATALAVAIPEPQGCDPKVSCCTFSESSCANRLDSCTRTCNGVATKGFCNDVGTGSLSCEPA
ncbi:uncharacterized protein LY79DRAFT_531610 [Colletotrichum navitas]|uniref:Uncharacterized protein n=1 Tax=Colletotrichum navitas TaxID=681940 RepID=A0AAD8UXG7_9PEZI|nr:uncharacterized protein LY79DRAFT_531610 [Colletotrichum navitas]KAK1561319.1 hypothetical protein LY79DRAFT_531610 [Colletotrichum navitas]